MSDSKELDTGAFSRWADRPWGSPWDGLPDVLAAAEEITEIGLARGMCYGMCPVYTVTLDRSGAARFEGEYFVALMGLHDAAVDHDAFADLARAIAFLGFQSLDHGYAARVTCQATASTWVVRGGVRQGVSNYGSAGPRTLAAIERLVDQLASTLAWRMVRPPAGRRDGVPIFVGSTLRPEDLPYSDDDERAHWAQRPRSVVGPAPADQGGAAPMDPAEARLRRKQVEAWMASLSAVEQQVLRLRFGLESADPRGVDDLGLSRERIRQIEVMALRKLRNPSRSRKLREYLE